MNLQEIFDQLTYGELSQLSIGGGEAGKIDKANYNRVLAHLNLALTALYKRFSLKESRLLLVPVANQVLYSISHKYAVYSEDSVETIRYLLDTAAAPFKDDILKIERILTDDGIDIPLNNGASIYSIFTPTATSLRIPLAIVNQVSDLPDWLKTVNLELVYRANHPKIAQEYGRLDFDDVQIELPDSHLEPLLLFIAARMLAPTGVGQFEGLASNNFMARYEVACQQIEQKNLQVDQGSQNDRLLVKGWV